MIDQPEQHINLGIWVTNKAMPKHLLVQGGFFWKEASAIWDNINPL